MEGDDGQVWGADLAAFRQRITSTFKFVIAARHRALAPVLL
jgi:hypothetical protein